MLKRLILCLDGTWNTADSEQITNIVRILDFIEPKVKTKSGIEEEQRVYYHNGVGTGLSTRDKIFGGATVHPQRVFARATQVTHTCEPTS